MKIFACLLDEIPDEGTHLVEINNEKYILYKEGFDLFAISAVCPHLGGPLEEGEIKEGCVTCPWHKWRFDLKSGHCENVSNQYLKTYRASVERNKVYLELDF